METPSYEEFGSALRGHDKALAQGDYATAITEIERAINLNPYDTLNVYLAQKKREALAAYSAYERNKKRSAFSKLFGGGREQPRYEGNGQITLR